MLISRGDAADFTRAIPVTILIMLSMSYLFAVFVTPLLSRGNFDVPVPVHAAKNRMAKVGKLRLVLCRSRHGRWALLVAAILVLIGRRGEPLYR